MDTALDEIRFLADSEHRVVVLDVLAAGPATRAALREATGASSATVGRILGDFESRGWVDRSGQEYSLTPVGSYVARSFNDLHDRMRTVRSMQGLLSSLPIEEMGLTVEHLADADVTRATSENPLALSSRLREIELDAVDARSLTMFFPEPCVDARHRAVVEGNQTFEAVFTQNAIETALTSPLAAKFEELVAADRMTLYFYDGDLPWSVFLNDGEACLVVRNEEQTAIGLVETDDPEVVEFAASEFETYREQSTQFTVDDLRERYGDLLSRA